MEMASGGPQGSGWLPATGPVPIASRGHPSFSLFFPFLPSLLLLLPPSSLPSLWRWHSRPGKAGRTPPNAVPALVGAIARGSGLMSRRACHWARTHERAGLAPAVKEGRSVALSLTSTTTSSIVRSLPTSGGPRCRWPLGKAAVWLGQPWLLPFTLLLNLSLSPHWLEAYLVDDEVRKPWAEAERRRRDGGGGRGATNGTSMAPFLAVRGGLALPAPRMRVVAQRLKHLNSINLR